MAATSVVGSNSSNALPTFKLSASDAPIPAQTLAFGQAFLPGAVPAGSGLAMVINGVTTPVQMEVRTRNPDGSVAFAQLIVPQPALAAGQTLTAALALAPASTAPAIDLAAILGAHTATVDLSFANGTPFHLDIIAAARNALADGTASYWQNGPYATQARIDVPVSGSLHLTFDLTATADGNFSIDAHFNNDLAMGANGGAATYGTTLTLDGAVTTVPSLTQAQYQNWHELLEAHPTSFVNVQQDLDYLQRTGLLQNYDPTRAAAASNDIAAIPGRLALPSWNAPLASNDIYQGMPDTGGRPDIGPTTGANADWLLTQDPNAAQYALDQAQAASSIPWHFQDVTTGDWLSVVNHPELWTDPRGGTGDPGGLTQQVDPNTGWTTDTAHRPDNSYIPYLLTGDRTYLDELNAAASSAIVGTWNDPRGNAQGLLANVVQVRAGAWSLRTVQEAAQINSDGSSDKAYFANITSTNWKWIVSQIPTWTAQQGEAYGHIPMDVIDKQFAPWQLDYFATTAAQAAIDGNADAKTFLEWSTNFLAGRFFQADNGYDPRTGVTYWQPTIDSAGQPITTWAGLQAAAVQSGSAGDWWPGGDFAEVALASLASTVSALGDSKEGIYAMKAFGWLVSSDAPNLTSDSQFQISPRLADGHLLNWSNITISHSTAGSNATLTGSDPNADQLLYAGAGDDTLTGGSGTNLLFGGTGHSTLVGSGTRNYLFGGSGNTLFRPGNGVNYLDVGSDTSSQSARGVDTIALSSTDAAQDTIADFDPRTDAIKLTGATNADVASALATATPTADGSGTTLTLSSTLTLTLQGFTPAQVTPTFFVLDQGITPAVTSGGTFGSGSDTLTVALSEDAYQGDAQANVSIDGTTLTATPITVTALHGAGASEVFTFKGNFGVGPHTVGMSFLNDAYGGSPSLDRNLYVNGVTLDGQASPNLPSGGSELNITSTQTFGVSGGTNPAPASASSSSQSDTLVLHLSEDAWQGDAQFVASLDGTQLGPAQSVTASHAAGGGEDFTYQGNFGLGPHDLAISFLNDAWGGTPQTDRNLYVNGVTFDGAQVPNAAAALYTASTVHIQVGAMAETG